MSSMKCLRNTSETIQREFFYLPLEILCEVFRYLEPLDLLHLARTTKQLRGFLLNRSESRRLWQAVIRNVQGLPPCPECMSEPAYTHLAFVPVCHGCYLPCQTIEWGLRLRSCPECYPDLTISSSSISFPQPRALGLPDDYYCCVTDSYGMDVKIRANRIVPRILASDWQVTADRWKQSNLSLDEFLVEERRFWLPIRKHFSRCMIWEFNLIRERAEQLSLVRSQRICDIVEKLGTLGWIDVPRHSPQFLQQDVVAKPEPLTPAEWSKIYPELVVTLPRIKEEFYRYRMIIATREAQSVLRKEPRAKTFPRPIDILLLPAVRDLVSDVNTRMNKDDLETMFGDLLPEAIRKWREDVVHDLKEVAREQFDLETQSVVESPSFTFRCSACDERFAFDSALRHPDLYKDLPEEWSRGDYPSYENVAFKLTDTFPLSLGVLQPVGFNASKGENPLVDRTPRATKLSGDIAPTSSKGPIKGNCKMYAKDVHPECSSTLPHSCINVHSP